MIRHEQSSKAGNVIISLLADVVFDCPAEVLYADHHDGRSRAAKVSRYGTPKEQGAVCKSLQLQSGIANEPCRKVRRVVGHVVMVRHH